MACALLSTHLVLRIFHQHATKAVRHHDCEGVACRGAALRKLTPVESRPRRRRGIIDSIACMEPLVFGYGRGAMDGFPMDPELPLDVVPVDTSINAILAALAATADRPGVHVFQIGTSHCNPLSAAPIGVACIWHPSADASLSWHNCSCMELLHCYRTC